MAEKKRSWRGSITEQGKPPHISYYTIWQSYFDITAGLELVWGLNGGGDGDSFCPNYTRRQVGSLGAG